MSTVELRENLIKKIKKTTDKNILEEAYRLLEMEASGIYKFTSDQKKEINKSRLQIKKGQTLTNKEADKEIDEWLSK